MKPNDIVKFAGSSGFKPLETTTLIDTKLGDPPLAIIEHPKGQPAEHFPYKEVEKGKNYAQVPFSSVSKATEAAAKKPAAKKAAAKKAPFGVASPTEENPAAKKAEEQPEAKKPVAKKS
ncbi:hypothetical protein JYU20_00560 [Bacteroidales bacterium AH-315-I05]|nr:hypothetical protein [Bacteroidales bacterium AH-315-I05]